MKKEINNLELSSEYLQLKISELSKIAPGKNLGFLMESSSHLDLFKRKKEVIVKCRSDFVNSKSITNLERKNIALGDLEFSYDYQRQGVFLENLERELIYQTNSSINPDFTILTNSGQSAGYALFQFFQSCWRGEKEINLFNKNNYHESFDAFSRLLKLRYTRFEENQFLNFFDSGVSQECLKELILQKSFKDKVLIIDTTCYDLSDKDLRFSLDRLLRDGATIFLTRSHIKLDCLGSEYGLMGSLVGYNTKNILDQVDYSIFNEGCALDYYGRDLKGILNKLISLTGGHVRIGDIYPFIESKDFRNMASSRTERIRKNCSDVESLAKEILDSAFLITTYEHKLFFLLDINGALSEEELAKILFKTTYMTKRKMFFCDSFGFDFPNITRLFLNNSYLATERGPSSFKFRISPGDVPAHMSNSNLNTFETFFRSLKLGVRS